MVSLAVTTATISDGASKVFKQLHRIVPSKAGVRHRLAIGHRLIELNVLTAFNKVGFNHHTDDVGVAIGDLIADVVDDVNLFTALLVRV